MAELPLPPSAICKHSKVQLAIRPSRTLYVAGSKLDGVLEVACSGDTAALGRIALEIRGTERELEPDLRIRAMF